MLRAARRVPFARRLLLFAFCVLPFLVSCGYEVALQPTATPSPAAGSLGVRQIPGAPPQLPEASAALAQAVQAAPAVAGSPATAPPATAATVPASAAAPAAESSTVRLQSAPAAQPASVAPTVAPPAAAAPAPPSATSRPAATVTTEALAPRPSASASTTPAGSPSAVRIPTPPATARPSATPAPAGLAIPTATPTPTPAPTPQSTAPRQVTLTEGTNDFTYVGPSLPVNQALAAIAGKYSIVYFVSPTTGELVAYKPNDPSAPTLPTNTAIRIIMNKGVYVSFSMAP